MEVAPGVRLGPYEVVAPLGAGGMGEVFRARDTRLDRTVAVKILPPLLAADAQFRARFDREARAISSLNHPHICTLHDIGEHGGTAFLVMEHLEGETLAARLSRGPLPIADALTIGTQVADALDAAHRRGIVHRDVKPGNIMLVRRGSSGAPSIKLLDFGLARTGPVIASASGEPAAQTMTQGLTGAGTILGTLQYMAPEQVEGLEADARTDIFALGVVLYEMVTGRRAFEGRTPASVIGAILKEEPPPVSTVSPLSPPALDRIVRRCLAKDPDDRWQTARDLRAELEWIAAGDGSARPVAAVTRTRLPERLAWSAAVVALAAALVFLATRPRESAPVFMSIETPRTMEIAGAGGGERLIAISPDGRRIAFAGTVAGLTQIFLRSLDQLEPVPLRGTENGSAPFFSPDSQTLGFVADGKLKTLPVEGGTVMVLCDAVNRGAVWGADDTIVFVPAARAALSRVSARGGTPEPFTTLGEREVSHRWPALMPDGRTVLFTAQTENAPPDEAFSVAVQSPGGAPRILVRGGTAPAYLPTGHLVFAREEELVAVPFDARRLEAAQTTSVLVKGLSMIAGSGAAQYAVAADGTLVYISGEAFERSLVWVSPGGDVRTLSEPRGYRDIALSPDGKYAAAAVSIGGAAPDIYVQELATGVLRRLTYSAAPEFGMAWTPDGQHVTYRSPAIGQIVRKRFDGSGVEEAVSGTTVDRPNAGAWHPDGDRLVVGSADILIVPTTGDRTPAPFLSTPAVEIFPTFSPDGRWIAYQSNETGRFEVYVQPFPATGPVWQISYDLGSRPIWAPKGKNELYYRSGNRMMLVRIHPGPTFSYDPPRVLFEGQYGPSYDVASDGRFLMLRSPPSDNPPTIRVVLNWLDLVRQQTSAR
jgi:serine/threonine-protein kinase